MINLLMDQTVFPTGGKDQPEGDLYRKINDADCAGADSVLRNGIVFTASNLLGNLIFSGIGFIAFFYGKKMSALRPALIGLVLMVYPYFVSSTLALYGIGAALTLALFLFRE